MIVLTKRNGDAVAINPDQILYCYEDRKHGPENDDGTAGEVLATWTVIVLPYAGDSGYGNVPVRNEIHVAESLTKVRGRINTAKSHNAALFWAQSPSQFDPEG